MFVASVFEGGELDCHVADYHIRCSMYFSSPEARITGNRILRRTGFKPCHQNSEKVSHDHLGVHYTDMTIAEVSERTRAKQQINRV
eukprot:6459453-Amphidinium_carterae.1